MGRPNGLAAWLLVASALSLPGCATVERSSVARVVAELRPSREAARPVLVVAHRGCWDGAPENSLAAIEACIAMGVDVVELDVRRTSDGVLVLMHDATVDRMTDGTGQVEALSYERIRRLRLRQRSGGFIAALSSEAPPTFEAAMQAARGRIVVNLDAKEDVYDDAFKVLEATGTTGQVILKRRVAEGDGALTRSQPFDRVIAMPILDQQAGSAPGLLAPQLGQPPAAAELIFTDIAFVEAAQPLLDAVGVRSWVNTLKPDLAGGLTDAGAMEDPDAVWGRLISMGVTMIQTDQPRRLLDYLARIGRRTGPQPPTPRL